MGTCSSGEHGKETQLLWRRRYVSMSKDTFPFTSTSLRSLRLEQEYQEWEDARRELAHRRAMARAPLGRAPRLPARPQRLQEVRAPPPVVRCRDPVVHNTFMFGDMKGVYAVLKDTAMVDAVMETVHEEMVWTPEMGMTFSDLSDRVASELTVTTATCLCQGCGR